MSIRSECYICGLDYPEEEMVRHYKTRRLVDVGCADEPTHSDYMSWMQLPEERHRRAEQPVSGQGEIVVKGTGKWYVGEWYVSKWYGTKGGN